MPGAVTWRELWLETEQLVASRSVARWICEDACGLTGAEFVASLDLPATERSVHHLDAMVARVRADEPVQYVLGHWAFRRIDLMVDPRVLIPRPETERLVDLAVGCLATRQRPHVCADLGTGSGAIGLSLAAELPLDGTTLWLTDVSSDALDVARANAAGVGRKSVNVRFAEGSWFAALGDELRGRLDLVVANPPYIAVDDPEVEASVRRWEPFGALYAGPEGLDHIREIVSSAGAWVAPGGWLLLEIGHRQAAEVADLLGASGWGGITTERDLAGRDRFAVARWPS